MVKYEIRHSVTNWKYGMEYLLSRHLFLLILLQKKIEISDQMAE